MLYRLLPVRSSTKNCQDLPSSRGTLMTIRHVLRPRRDQIRGKGPVVNGSDVVPALPGRRRLSTTRISGLHHTAFGLAVYASQRRLPATTQDSLPVAGPSSTGRDSNPQGSYRKVSNLVIHPPFPSFLAQPGFLIKPFRPSRVAMGWKAPILQGKVAQQS